MNKRVVRRLLETFFRRWYLYLVPLVLFTGVGVYKAMGLESGYRSVGVIDVSKGTLLSELTSIRGENYGYDTPANSTARTMSSLLGTRRFILDVVERAGLTEAVRAGVILPDGIRGAISASAGGDTLLRVVATSSNPEVSANLAKATIESFIEYTVEGDVSESRAAEQFFQNQVAEYQAALDRAQASLDGYVAQHPDVVAGDERPLVIDVEVQRLQTVVEQAQVRVAAAQQKVEEARLATEQATEDVRQRLRMVDEPQPASAPQPRRMDMITTIATFFLAGLLLSVGAVVVAAVLDRSLWSGADVEHFTRLPVLASLGETSKRQAQHVAGRAAFAAMEPVGAVPSAVNGHSDISLDRHSTARPRPASNGARTRRPARVPKETSS
jgi:uncharacterized protein involved in exopolysaccharide biosynthesis